MTILNSRADVLELAQQPEFFKVLLIDTAEQYQALSPEMSARFGLHCDSPWDEDNFSGIDLFRTPLKQLGDGKRFGTWLHVSKQFNSQDRPFRVTACERVPWGVEVARVHVGDFSTFGQAVDDAFAIHENGHIEIHIPFQSRAEPRARISYEETSQERAECNHEVNKLNHLLESLIARGSTV